MKTLLFALFLFACATAPRPLPDGVWVTVEIVPIRTSRPCIVYKVEVLDDAGGVYHPAQADCTRSTFALPPGRSFAGFHVDSLDLQAITVSLSIAGRAVAQEP